MSGLSSSALEDHLQRYESSSNAGDDEGYRACPEGSVQHAIGEVKASEEEPSFLSMVFADSTPNRGTIAYNVLPRWWRRHNPLIMHLIHKYGALLIKFLARFSPRGARRAGYRLGSHDVLRSLDRLDAEMPGGERGWSRRWRSRWPKERSALSWEHISMNRAVGGVGVAATAVVLAAVSWCSWRRSSPSWPVLLAELACGSTWAAHYAAREDGHKEATLFHARLVALEHSLARYFRGVQACMRMVRCSQALSFGLRLSVPMPPVARMEGRLSAAPGIDGGPGRAEMALRDLRAVLADVLEGAVVQLKLFESKQRCAVETRELGNSFDLSRSEDDASDAGNCQSPYLLGAIAGVEGQVAARLRRFVVQVAEKMEQTLAGPEVWGLWWDSEMEDVSEAVRDMAAYFEAAVARLDIAIGSGGLPFPTVDDPAPPDDVAAAAVALSSLRLQYEEAVVRLYSCQSRVSAVLRDPTNSTAEGWEVVRRELCDARVATGAASDCDELWGEAERVIASLAKADGAIGAADLIPVALPSSDTAADASRPLETGVGWISLTSPRGEGPRVFEGGHVDEGSEEKARRPSSSDSGVTHVLVGVPSPRRSRYEGENTTSRSVTEEMMDDERSRSQLVGELDSVLRARSLPPTCEKRLPLESQQSLEDKEDCEIGDEEYAQRPFDATPPPQSVASVMEEPVGASSGSRDLMSELKAQLSMAANEEIFSSDRDQWTVTSDGEEDSIFVQADQGQNHNEHPS